MKELTTIQLRLNAPKGETNNFGGYKYRTCESILRAVKPLLKEVNCNIKLSDDIVMIGDRIYIVSTATLTNEAGEVEQSKGYARESLGKKGMDDAQVTGASSSYARKYALAGLLAIDGADDPDRLNVTAEYSEPEPQPVMTVDQQPVHEQPKSEQIAEAIAYHSIFERIDACKTKKELCNLMTQNREWSSDSVIKNKCYQKNAEFKTTRK